MRIADAAGGLEAFASLPALRFDFAVVRDTAEVTRRRHLWDRKGDRYRLEWTGGEDSVYVALFSPSAFDDEAPAGQVALNGQALSGEARDIQLRDAYETYINDSYWLLAPLKLFDPGVRRAIDPDSGASMLAVSFDGVGLTPGDRYWVKADGVSGAMTGWSYQLEGATSVGMWDWTEAEPIDTPRGPLTLATAKTKPDGSATILTTTYPVPAASEGDGEANASLWTDLAPRLAPDQ